MTLRSGPATLTPTGVLMPVASMSSLFLIGMIQTLVRLGTSTREFNSAFSDSMVTPRRHSDRGFNWMVVSTMGSGAGSVAVSARPALAYTVSTSGIVLISLSVC